MLWYSKANLDTALAEALNALDLDSATHPFYEGVPETFQKLRPLGIKVVAVSDIHFDIRPRDVAAGLSRSRVHFV